MKKVAVLAVGFLVLSACGGGGGNGTVPVSFLSNVKLQPVVAGSVSPGQAFSVNVVVTNVPNLFQAAWRVNYDAALLQFTGLSVGPVLQKDSDPPACLTLLSGSKDLIGKAAVFISRQGSGCGNADKISGILATLNFTALQPISSTTLNNLVTFPTDISRFLVRDSGKKPFTLSRIDPAQLGVVPH